MFFYEVHNMNTFVWGIFVNCLSSGLGYLTKTRELEVSSSRLRLGHLSLSITLGRTLLGLNVSLVVQTES